MEQHSTQEELSTIKKELQQHKSKLETLSRETTALTAQLSAFESRMARVEETLEGNAKRPKVAFSVGLSYSGVVGPYNVDTTLVYQKVFCNLGQAYDLGTGIFTAPAKGVYFYTFTGFNNQVHPTALTMYHNQRKLLHNWGPGSQHMFFSNSTLIQMEAGDVVYMRLSAGFALYDDGSNYCSLSGFLLFIV